MKIVNSLKLAAAVFFVSTGAAMAGMGCSYGAGTACKVPALLVGLAVGYWVLTLAQKESRPLDVLGRLIGGVILLVSLVGLVCVASSRFCAMKSGACPIKGDCCAMGRSCAHKMAKCPVTGETLEAAPQEVEKK